MNKKMILPMISLFIVIMSIVAVIVLANNREYSDPMDFSGIIKSATHNQIVLDGGKKLELNSKVSYKSTIEALEVTGNFAVGNFISGTYYTENNNEIVEEININVEPIFSGKIIELYNDNAIVTPNDEEVYILSSADQVYVTLPTDHGLDIGDNVTVRYDGRLKESYPLQIVTLSVNGMPVN